ncbi:MAG: hypothetical protein GXP45_08590 [bacterium]|nr:hypothetical protein [bacterium]
MIKSKFFLVSKDISVDAFTQTLSLFTLIENLNVAQVPFIFPSITVTAYLERSDLSKEEHIHTKIIIKNNDNIVQEKTQEIGFNNKLGHKWINNFHNLEVKEFGTLSFLLETNGELINQRDVKVNELPEQATNK